MKTVLTGILLILGLGHASANPQPTLANAAQARVAIPQAIESLRQAPDWQLLRTVFNDITRIPEDRKLPTWEADRDFKLVSLCSLLTLIDKLKDPRFDPTNPGVELEADVPPNSGLMPGEDPAGVKDTVLKAKYLAMIKEQDDKLLQVNLQNDLIRIRRECAAYASRYIKTRYTPNERGDQLKALIQNAFNGDTKSGDIVSMMTAAINAK